MKNQTLRKLSLAVGAASVATSLGNVAVKAGPALQSLTNLTNTAGLTVNNTYGQTFSADGITSMSTGALFLQPFVANAGAKSNFNAGNATLTTGFEGGAFGAGFRPVTQVIAAANIGTGNTPLELNGGTTGVSGLRLQVGSATQTIGASISQTTFGINTVNASSSFTNQQINDLSAF